MLSLLFLKEMRKWSPRKRNDRVEMLSLLQGNVFTSLSFVR